MHLPLFIYGTLLEGQRNRRLLNGKLQRELPASTSGTLLLIEGDGYPYPALLPGDGSVHGSLVYPQREVYRQLISEIDCLEDYDASRDSGLYLRRTIEVTCGGATLPAQGYLWNGPATAGAVLKHGDFRFWCRAQCARATV